MINKPLISIVIPTYNSEATIKDCLDSIINQYYSNFEILIVDGFSKDKTLSIAKRYPCKIFKIKALRSEAKNFGAKKARGKGVLFLDSDTILTKGVISSCAKKLVKSDAVIIPEKIVGNGFWLKIKAFERELYTGTNVEAPWFFNKKSFLDVGGYDTKLEAGEDWDLRESLKTKGYKIDYISDFILHNQGHLNFNKLIKKKFYYGRSILSYVKKNKRFSVGKFPFFRFYVLKNNLKRILRNPVKSAGVIFIKTFETLSLLSGMLYYKFNKKGGEK